MKTLLPKSLHSIKTLFLFFPLLVTAPFPASPSLFVGLLNDNYTRTVKNGKQGQYIGADDFLTYSMAAGLGYEPYHFHLTYNIITSRTFGFRYDLLSLNSSYSIKYGKIIYRPGLELNLKSQLGGRAIQNGFHEIINIPPVHLPYDSKSSLGIGVTGEGERNWSNILIKEDRFSLALESRLSSLLPGKLGVNSSYHLHWWRVHFEFLLGLRLYSTYGHHYAKLIRSGFLSGGNFKFRLYKTFCLNWGLAFFPAENLENDPLYKDKDFSYSPQIWTMFSINAPHLGLREFLRFF